MTVRDRIVKAEFWHGRGASTPFTLLAEGDNLSDDEVMSALQKFLGREPTAKDKQRVAVTNDKGERWRRWRFAGDAAVRVVDGTIYL